MYKPVRKPVAKDGITNRCSRMVSKVHQHAYRINIKSTL